MVTLVFEDPNKILGHLKLTERIVTFGGKKPVKGRNVYEREDQRQWQRGGSHSDAETGRRLSLPSQSWESRATAMQAMELLNSAGMKVGTHLFPTNGEREKGLVELTF